MPEENKVIPGHSEGDTGYLSGYIPTGDDRRIREVYRDWVHYNYGAHPSEGIDDGRVWKTRWQALAVMTARRYGAPSGRVRRRFVHALSAELTGVRKQCWNAERLILIQMVILQRARHMTSYSAIRRRINLGCMPSRRGSLRFWRRVRLAIARSISPPAGERTTWSVGRRSTTDWCSG